MQEKKKRENGLIFSLFMALFTIYPPVVNSTSVFIKPVTNGLHLESQSFILYITIMSLTNIGLSPFIGQWLHKFGAKKVMTLGVLAIFISLIGFSFAHLLWQFYLLALLQGAGLAATCTIPPSLITNNWFRERRGTVLGIALAGSGVGGGVYNPFIQLVIDRFGWRAAYLISGLLILVIMLPLIYYFIDLYPPAEFAPKSAEPTTATKEATAGLTRKEMFKEPSFYLLLLGIVASGIIINGNLVNISPLLVDLGYRTGQASIIIGLSLISTTIGKVILGWLLDNIKAQKTLLLVILSMFAFLLILLKANSLFLIILYIIIVGIATANATVTPPIITVEILGEREFTEKYSIISIFVSLGTAISPIYTNFLLNQGKSYANIYQSYLILAAVFAVSMLLAISLSKKKKQKLSNC